MSEENKMTEENKKTIIAFIAGLLVGGLLVFIFVDPVTDTVVDDNSDNNEEVEVTEVEVTEETEEVEEEEIPSSTVSEENVSVTGGSVTVADQEAGGRVHFNNASFPVNEGWVGVREYENGQLTGLLGAARWSKSESLLPTSVGLLRPTVAGNTYAIVFYTENGDKVFSLATDRQMSSVMETFEAE